MPMIRLKLKHIILVGIFIFGLFFFILPVRAEWANHVVISEVQIAGQTTNDEFIELFNSTNQPIDLTDYVLKKKTSSGSESNLVVSSRFKDKIIQPKSFLLLAPEENYLGTVTPDIIWPKSYNLAPNNTIILYNVSSTPFEVDKVGWGIAADYETLPSLNPNDNQRLERKASQYSTAETLVTGGEEESSGNAWDTDNNADDFILQTAPNPQNSSSSPESEPPLPEPSNQGPVCGDGIVGGDEQCDGNDLNNQTCSLLGFVGGILTCNSNCIFNTSTCNTGGGGGYSPPTYQAQPGDVVINEIFPEPDSQKEEIEWIEIYNRTEHVFDLTDWTIEDNTHKPKSLSNISLPAHSFFVLIKGEHFTFSLNNSGDIIILKRSETLIDQVAYGDFENEDIEDNAPKPGKSKSIGRNTESGDTDNDKNDFSFCKETTPEEINEIEIIDLEENEESDGEPQEEIVDMNYQNFQIYLSEFLPNPTGLDSENEWIEIYNAGDEEIDLEGWQIDDAEGGSKPYKFSEETTIEAEKYLVVWRPQSKIALNNTFDSVRLINLAGEVHYQIDYQKPPEGAGYARNDNDNWFWTSALTPGTTNIFEQKDEENLIEETEELFVDEGPNLISTNELKNLEENAEVIIQGVVVLPPGDFAKTYFYINGAQIYCYKGEFPELEIGDFIEIIGRVSRAFSHKRVKIRNSDDIVVLSRYNKVTSQPVNADELNEELVGYLVEASGQLIEKTGSKFYLDNNGDEIEVYIKSKTEIDKKVFKEGQWLKATGILTESVNGWRILPRWQDDLVIEENFDNQQMVSDNSNDISEDLTMIQRTTSSIGQLWSLIVQNKLKYLIISAVSLMIILFSLFLKLKGTIK